MTIGFPGAHDLRFSSTIASMMNIPHHAKEIDKEEFLSDLQAVRTITGCPNVSHIENCIAYREIARLARKIGVGVILSANGCDELFCGYNGYRTACVGGPGMIMEMMAKKIDNERELVAEITLSTSEYGISVRQPFLSANFIEFSKSVPLHDKIRGSDDMLRKHALRKAALDLGVPAEAALKPKKALQYGSLVHKHYQKAIKGGT